MSIVYNTPTIQARESMDFPRDIPCMDGRYIILFHLYPSLEKKYSHSFPHYGEGILILSLVMWDGLLILSLTLNVLEKFWAIPIVLNS